MDSNPKLLVNLTNDASISGKIEKAIGSEKPVYTFLGVPYAAAPVGERRFQPPAKPKYWTGTRDATKHGPICPQNYQMSELMLNIVGNYEMPQDRSEDCLYLNIYTPDPDPKKQYPVMLWIHGGAFTLGFSNVYVGTALASYHDVVFVSINYRLGIFGLLCTGEDGVVNGNAGLLDQIAALQWVQQHIAKFGGNPENVTIFGESAGAFSTSLLVASDLTKGLFHRAISQSGVCFFPGGLRTQETAGKSLRSLLAKHGFTSTDSHEIIAYLKAMSTEDLNNLQELEFNMAVVIDNHCFKDFPENIYSAKKHQPVDHIIGFNSHEGALLALILSTNPLSTREDAHNYVKESIGNSSLKNEKGVQKVIDDVCKKYIDCKPEDELKKAVVQMCGDFWFGAPSIHLANKHSETNRTFVYLFDHRLSFSKQPEWVKGDHGDDILPVFGEPFLGLAKHEWTETDTQLSINMMKYWTNFAKTGNPNGDDLPNWPSYNKQDKKYMILGEKLEVGSNYKPDVVEFWQETVPDIAKSDC